MQMSEFIYQNKSEMERLWFQFKSYILSQMKSKGEITSIFLNEYFCNVKLNRNSGISENDLINTGTILDLLENICFPSIFLKFQWFLILNVNFCCQDLIKIDERTSLKYALLASLCHLQKSCLQFFVETKKHIYTDRKEHILNTLDVAVGNSESNRLLEELSGSFKQFIEDSPTLIRHLHWCQNAPTQIVDKNIEEDTNSKYKNFKNNDYESESSKKLAGSDSKTHSKKSTLDDYVSERGAKKLVSCSKTEQIFHESNLCEAPGSLLTKCITEAESEMTAVKYFCTLCGAQFKSRKILCSHLNMHFSQNKFTCNVCGSSYSKLSELKLHKCTPRTKNNLRQHKLTLSKTCKSTSYINKNQHAELSKMKQIKERKKTKKYFSKNTFNKIKKNYSCYSCHASFITKSHLNAHLKIDICQKQKKRLSCNTLLLNEVDACSTFDDITKVAKTNIDTNKRLLTCERCDFTTLLSSQLRSHYKIHFDDKFVCQVCGVSFLDKAKLKRHEMVHTGEQPFSCEICGKRFADKSHLTVHLRIHSGEKPFKCNFEGCSSAFVESSKLKNHMRRHTGEKPYVCEVCGLSFRVLYSLKSHMRRHTGDKPYKCTFCSYASSQSSNLKAHMTVHNGNRQYCSMCTASFNTITKLNKHVTVHFDIDEDNGNLKASAVHNKAVYNVSNFNYLPSCNGQDISTEHISQAHNLHFSFLHVQNSDSSFSQNGCSFNPVKKSGHSHSKEANFYEKNVIHSSHGMNEHVLHISGSKMNPIEHLAHSLTSGLFDPSADTAGAMLIDQTSHIHYSGSPSVRATMESTPLCNDNFFQNVSEELLLAGLGNSEIHK